MLLPITVKSVVVMMLMLLLFATPVPVARRTNPMRLWDRARDGWGLGRKTDAVRS